MANYLNGTGVEFCSHCKRYRTIEGHDGCIGTLDNVMNACCGHGEKAMAYVQFDHNNYNEDPNKVRLSGEEAIDYIKCNSTIK